jgi:hypothetical protein
MLIGCIDAITIVFSWGSKFSYHTWTWGNTENSQGLPSVTRLSFLAVGFSKSIL